MASSAGQDKEFVVKIPARNETKTFHVMKFNASLNVNACKWTQVRMVRENNKREFKTNEEETPKFGAGSEFGREQKEEARRKRFGINPRKYDPDMQPWLIRIGNKKEGKQYKGIREGGISENTAYYVFTHAQDGSFEAHSIKEWYNFIPRVTYSTLDADEAEEKFAQRSKILNHFAVMVNRKLKPTQDEDEPDFDSDSGKGKKKSKKVNDLKVSDMDEWLDSDQNGDEFSDEDDDDNEEGGKNKSKKDKGSGDESGGKGKGKGKGKKKKKKSDDEDDDEAFEDSDDGDDEGREVDYMSDESSDSEDELQAKADIKGVDQDEGLSKMLDSDSSEEEDKEEEDKDEEDDDGGDVKDKKKKSSKSADGKKSNKSSANNSRAPSPSHGGKSPAGSDSSMDGTANAGGNSGPGGSGSGAAAGSSNAKDSQEDKSNRAEKRKALVDTLMDLNAEPSSKKSRMEGPSSSLEAAFEEDVRRYLARKPMTTTELLKKFKSKKPGVAKNELMALLVNVLKRLNPHKQKVKGIMYLSLKADK